MASLKVLGKTSSGVGVLIIAIVCVNVIASRLHGRLDVTADKLYTLSDGTKDILKGLKGDVEAKLYFSSSIKELPVPIKTYASRVEEVLGEYAAQSKGHLTVAVVDPKPDTDEEEWARKYGIQGVPLPGGTEMFFGVVFLQANHEIAIPYLDPRREEFLEYDLSEALLHSEKSEKQKIGILSSLPVMQDSGLSDYQGAMPTEWAFVGELRKSFNVVEVQKTAKSIPNDLGVLLLYHPKDLSDETVYAIDQYVLRGGRLIAMVDPMSRIEQMHNARNGMQNPGMPQETSSDLGKLFAAWGINYSTQALVGDTKHSVMINAGGQEIDYPFFMNLADDSLSKTSVITGKLNSFMFAEGGSFDVRADAGVKLEPLLVTAKSAGTVPPMYGGFSNPIMLIPQLKSGDKELVLAGVVTGKFKSAFADGRPKASDEKGSGEADSGGPHLAEAEKESSIIVIADTDFIFDNNAVDKMRFLNQVLVRPKNGNLAFLINSVDFLGGSRELISIRSKGKVSRPFTVVENLQRNAQEHWKKVEDDLSAQINDLQKKLSELQAQRADGSSFQMTPEQQAEIAKFREEERQVRMKRREVRKNLREDIESLGNRLAAANLLVVPVCVSGFGIMTFVRRARKSQKGKQR